ncbi:MAG TPA: extracellular solute-binding protein [Microbacteriaceae bacterium]|nr:extracellular solute-binding protein [Microbacteriaceae bacterium]
MQRKKITVALVAAAVTSLALTGCSSGGAQDGSTTVSYMTWESNAMNKALDATMKKFEKSSDITVKREAAPNADYAQKLASLIMSKKAPDFFWCTTGQAQNLADEGLLYDWSSHLKGSGGLQAKNFSPGSLEMWRTESGKLSGIPTLANTYGFFYNKAAFDKAGLPVPKIGWTYDDMFNDIAKLKQLDPSSTPLVTQWQLLDSPQGISAYSVANGGKPLLDSSIGAKSIHADATFREGAQRFAAAIAAGQMTNPDYDASNATAAFTNGGIPLMFGGQWLQTLIAPNKPSFDWGYAPWPVGTKKSVQPIEANGVCSPSTVKNPDAVWKTISYMDTTGFNDSMKQQPVAPIAYEPGSKGYYAALDSGDAPSKSISATARYELGTKTKFVTAFLDTWATKAAAVVTTSWNPALEGKKSLSAGIDDTVTGIKRLMAK